MTPPPATILVVDDLPANRLVIERHLARLGYATAQAEDGRRALDVLHATSIDLVLLDIMMPVMNGFEALEAIKTDPTLAAIPVVVVSALNDVESIARCIALGAEDFLFKPVERVLLEARVAACLARKRAHDREQAALAAAEEASRAKDRFVALVSHELKNPLTALIGFADMLVQPEAPELDLAQQEAVNNIRGLGRQMGAVLEDLADLTRIESGQLRLRPEALPLESVVESALSSVQGLIEARGHTLTLDLPADLPPVWADGVRLTQVLTNLLNNACKYTPDGGTVSVSARLSSPALVEVTVRDNGPGIVSRDQARIFEPFFRSTDEAVRRQPGSGLGLSITRHLVELQGGAIRFESAPGQGTAFSFTVLTAGPEGALRAGPQ